VGVGHQIAELIQLVDGSLVGKQFGCVVRHLGVPSGGGWTCLAEIQCRPSPLDAAG
jgi:hypothetical protein